MKIPFFICKPKQFTNETLFIMEEDEMKTYRVFLSYVKEFIVEADSYEEAIRKAHEGDVISTGNLTACPEDDYADEERRSK